MESLAGFNPVHHLNTADFHHPVAILRIKAGGFGVENYFPHKFNIGLNFVVTQGKLSVFRTQF